MVGKTNLNILFYPLVPWQYAHVVNYERCICPAPNVLIEGVQGAENVPNSDTRTCCVTVLASCTVMRLVILYLHPTLRFRWPRVIPESEKGVEQWTYLVAYLLCKLRRLFLYPSTPRPILPQAHVLTSYQAQPSLANPPEGTMASTFPPPPVNTIDWDHVGFRVREGKPLHIYPNPQRQPASKLNPLPPNSQ